MGGTLLKNLCAARGCPAARRAARAKAEILRYRNINAFSSSRVLRRSECWIGSARLIPSKASLLDEFVCGVAAGIVPALQGDRRAFRHFLEREHWLVRRVHDEIGYCEQSGVDFCFRLVQNLHD